MGEAGREDRRGEVCRRWGRRVDGGDSRRKLERQTEVGKDDDGRHGLLDILH